MASEIALAGSEAAADTRTRNDIITVEMKEIKALFPAPMIEACNTSFVQVIIM
ncbi:unnamed protein product [Ascophyllum nodosum]